MNSPIAMPATSAVSTLYFGPWYRRSPFFEKTLGTVTVLIWSPRLARNIGYVWLPIALSGPGTPLEIEAPDGGLWPARSAAIPFLDPEEGTLPRRNPRSAPGRAGPRRARDHEQRARGPRSGG